MRAATPKEDLALVGGHLPGQLLLPAKPAPPAAASAGPAAQLRQAQWQIEALHTLIDQAEATYKIDIRNKGGVKPSK